MIEIIICAFTASLWCLGLWTVTEPGKLLAFLKQPILKHIKNREQAYAREKQNLLLQFQDKTQVLTDEYKDIYRKEYLANIALLDYTHKGFLMKIKMLNPVILCPACMGSVHGFLCFSMFYPITWHIIIVMFITSGLNHIWHEKAF